MTRVTQSHLPQFVDALCTKIAKEGIEFKIADGYITLQGFGNLKSKAAFALFALLNPTKYKTTLVNARYFTLNGRDPIKSDLAIFFYIDENSGFSYHPEADNRITTRGFASWYVNNYTQYTYKPENVFEILMQHVKVH